MEKLLYENMLPVWYPKVLDIENGDKFMKVYKQMKMYNDEDLNPVLYQNKK
jgi:hypothetical protein